MLSLSTTNTQKLGYDTTVYADRVADYLTKIDARDQGFYTIVDDMQLVADIQAYADQHRDQFDHIVVLGIGGSALGTRTLREGLLPVYQQAGPTLHIIDNVDPGWVTALLAEINLARTLFIPNSKSGGTPETLSLYGFFRQQVEAADLEVAKHFVFITDPVNGLFRDIADRDGMKTFPIPPNVGGRFSVLTAVGLLPAALVGIDLESLMAGAQVMRDSFLNKNFDQNIPFQLAALQYHLGTEGFTNVVLMPYVQQLRTLADWYKQLLAESTGKIDTTGNNTGLTPMAAVGATDQHSMVQQYVQGIPDKQFCVIRQQSFADDPRIPNMGDHDKVSYLNDVSFGTLLNTELRATTDTFTEEGRPNYIIDIPTLDAHVLGQLFLLFEGATAFLGEFYDIDAFDQPGVERGKVLTRQYLSA